MSMQSTQYNVTLTKTMLIRDSLMKVIELFGNKIGQVKLNTLLFNCLFRMGILHSSLQSMYSS